MENKLKPCPKQYIVSFGVTRICGGRAEIKRTIEPPILKPIFYAECTVCGHIGHGFYGRPQAIESWNRRAK